MTTFFQFLSEERLKDDELQQLRRLKDDEPKEPRTRNLNSTERTWPLPVYSYSE